MADSTPYTRLPGRAAGLAGRHSLWLGAHHLLLVETGAVSERYKRIELADIQALTVSENDSYNRWGAAFLAGLILTGLFVLISGGGFRIFWGSCAAFWVLALIVHFARGKTCTTQIRTPVQSLTVPALVRIRKARAAVARLRDEVERVQGRIESADLQERVDEIQEIRDVPVRRVPPQERDVGELAADAYSGRPHDVLAGFLLLQMFTKALGLVVGGTWVSAAQLTVFVGVFLATVAAIVRQRNMGLPPVWRRWTWSSLAYAIVFSVAAYVAVMFASFTAAFEGELMADVSEVTGALESFVWIDLGLLGGLVVAWIVMKLRYPIAGTVRSGTDEVETIER